MEKIVALCKRRGFIFQSSEIYGGLASTYDYGHYGVLLKNNVKGEWWRAVIQERDDMVALDAAILMHPRTWEASGHLAGLHRPARAVPGQVQEALARRPPASPERTGELRCPECGGELGEAREFNLMFETFMGPVRDDAARIFLRPETAQGIFVNFKNVLQFSRRKPPFGIAQIGKAFRNEITPGNFIFRTREFEQMEIEFFVPPAEAEEWYQRWMDDRMRWYTDLGIRPDHLQLREHGAGRALALLGRRPATSSTCSRWAGRSSRESRTAPTSTCAATPSSRARTSRSSTPATEERYVPYVIEPSAGADRATLAFMVDAFDEEEVAGRKRTRAAAAPAPRAGEGRGAAARLARRDAREGARNLRGATRA